MSRGSLCQRLLDGARRRQFDHNLAITTLDFTPGNCLLCGDEAGSVIIWDPSDGFVETLFRTHTRVVTRVVSGQGTSPNHIATSSEDGRVRVTDVMSPEQPLGDFDCGQAVFDMDVRGTTMASAGLGGIQLFDPRTAAGAVAGAGSSTQAYRSIRFMGDPTFAVASQGDRALLFDLRKPIESLATTPASNALPPTSTPAAPSQHSAPSLSQDSPESPTTVPLSPPQSKANHGTDTQPCLVVDSPVKQKTKSVFCPARRRYVQRFRGHTDAVIATIPIPGWRSGCVITATQSGVLKMWDMTNLVEMGMGTYQLPTTYQTQKLIDCPPCPTTCGSGFFTTALKDVAFFEHSMDDCGEHGPAHGPSVLRQRCNLTTGSALALSSRQDMLATADHTGTVQIMCL